MGNFKECLKLVLKSEGGYVDHPKDPGGATNKGVTLAVYRANFGQGKTKEDLKNMTQTELEMIYRLGYWEKCRCDDLPDGIDYAVFDAAVNSGVSRSSKWLQMVLCCKEDGIIGKETIGIACRNSNVSKNIVSGLIRRRIEFLQNLSTWPTFGKGWKKRVDSVKRDALAMIEP